MMSKPAPPDAKAEDRAHGELKKAIHYTLNAFDALRRFVFDGRLEIDNNPIERCMRLIVLAKQNSIGVGSHEAAQVWAIFYTLIESARLNRVNPRAYPDPESLWLRAGVAPAVLERLAESDAFAGQGYSRRDALWAVRAIRAPAPLPLLSDPLDGEGLREPAVSLPAMHQGEEVVEDYIATRLTLRAHPMEPLRPDLPPTLPHDRLAAAPAGQVSVCGRVITRQRPGTASGAIFLTLEDETDVSNIVVWPKIHDRFRRIVMGASSWAVGCCVSPDGCSLMWRP